MSELSTLGTSQLVGFVLVVARLVPLFVLAPLFSSKMVPIRVRGIVAVALGLGLTPLAVRGNEVPVDPLTVGSLLAKELLVGLTFAFVIGILFAALTVAGALLDTLVGFSFGATVDPISGNQGSAVLAQLYGLVGVMVFIAIGGDGLVIRGLAETYQLVPLLEYPVLAAMIDGATGAFVGIFSSALQVAAPVVLALVLTDAAFGLITRVVPQLNVFAVGLPAKVLVSIVLVGASLPFVAGMITTELEKSVSTALGSLGVS